MKIIKTATQNYASRGSATAQVLLPHDMTVDDWREQIRPAFDLALKHAGYRLTQPISGIIPKTSV